MKTGDVLFAVVYDNDRQEMINEAISYIKEQGHTQDTVRIAEREGNVIVVVVK